MVEMVVHNYLAVLGTSEMGLFPDQLSLENGKCQNLKAVLNLNLQRAMMRYFMIGAWCLLIDCEVTLSQVNSTQILSIEKKKIYEHYILGKTLIRVKRIWVEGGYPSGVGNF